MDNNDIPVVITDKLWLKKKKQQQHIDCIPSTERITSAKACSIQLVDNYDYFQNADSPNPDENIF